MHDPNSSSYLGRNPNSFLRNFPLDGLELHFVNKQFLANKTLTELLCSADDTMKH